MSTLTHLDNFPFVNMEDFNAAFNNGIAEPVVPGDFARKWASSDPNSTVKVQVILFNRVIPYLILGAIIYLTFKSDELKWYHTLIAMFACVFAFSKNLSSIFRTLSTIILLAITIYLYVIHSAFANLIALAFGFSLTIKVTDYFALKDIVEQILSNVDFATELWNNKIMAIRYTDGKVIFKDKQIKTTPTNK